MKIMLLKSTKINEPAIIWKINWKLQKVLIPWYNFFTLKVSLPSLFCTSQRWKKSRKIRNAIVVIALKNINVYMIKCLQHFNVTKYEIKLSEFQKTKWGFYNKFEN